MVRVQGDHEWLELREEPNLDAGGIIFDQKDLATPHAVNAVISTQLRRTEVLAHRHGICNGIERLDVLTNVMNVYYALVETSESEGKKPIKIGPRETVKELEEEIALLPNTRVTTVGFDSYGSVFSHGTGRYELRKSGQATYVAEPGSKDFSTLSPRDVPPISPTVSQILDGIASRSPRSERHSAPLDTALAVRAMRELADSDVGSVTQSQMREAAASLPFSRVELEPRVEATLEARVAEAITNSFAENVPDGGSPPPPSA